MCHAATWVPNANENEIVYELARVRMARSGKKDQVCRKPILWFSTYDATYCTANRQFPDRELFGAAHRLFV